jgi:tetratricopeptide (TPR) repeat protein
LGDARGVAQIGAVLGREFSYALLRTVAEFADPGLALSERGYSLLDVALEKLVEADLLFVEGVAPAATYRFKHALIQDAAYESLLKSRRQALHRSAGEALLRSPDPQPELVAHHFTIAAQTELAIEWWGKAGDAALRRSAFQEAISHLGKAIEMTNRDAGPRKGAAKKLTLEVSLANAMMASRGQGAPETKAVVERIQVLAADDSDIIKRSLAYFGLWVGRYVHGDLDGMREQIEVFSRDLAVSPSLPMEGLMNRLRGAQHWFAGEFEAADHHFKKALELFDPERDHEFLFQFSHDFGSSAMIHSAMALWPLGQVDLARRRVEEMAARSEQVRHTGTAALANTYSAIFELIRSDAVRAAPRAAALAALARTHDMAQWKAYGEFFEGWAQSRSGEPDQGLAKMRGGLALLRKQEVVVFVPLMHALVAEREAERREFDAALAALNEAQAVSKQTGQRWYDAELQRIRGEILLRQGLADQASSEAAFLNAIAIARSQKARSFELRGALALARFRKSIGRPLEARDAVVPALEGFSPTAELPAIWEAEALVKELRR